MNEAITSLENQSLILLPALNPHSSENHFQAFWIRYSGKPIPDSELKTLASLCSDTVDQAFWVNPNDEQLQKLSCPQFQVITFRPGVTDNPASSFKELLHFHSLFQERIIEVHSGQFFLLNPSQNTSPFNPLIQESKVFEMQTGLGKLLQSKSFFNPKTQTFKVETFDLRGLSPQELNELSQKGFWALSEAEMLIIQKHFQDRALTDVEIEVLAQTWSEHCKHKIFAANIEYEGKTIKSLFKTFIEKPTHELQKKKDWAISVFKDNAGIVRFHESVDLCIKVETHNSPSALDPYGGALTGILGVNRDIMGTGLGARPIANTNVLLFGEPTETEPLPQGLLHPKTVFEGVHRGIQDGGNKSGIPTINGAIQFDESFSGKPLVFCGTVGVLPREIKGVPSASKNQKPGDYIVMVGGAVGLDGIHGATQSSLALDHTTPSSMVQIGDPLTQKRVLDFLLEARDQLLYSSVTDNGAGGLSSSIGEMAEQTNGAKVYLHKVPLKYPGLLPWQIFVSESQERMTFSVPKEKFEALHQLAIARGVEASCVGEFTDSGRLEIFYEHELVGDLSLEFLHHGLPKMNLKAKWNGPETRSTWKKSPKKLKPLSSLQNTLESLVKDPSLASKEKWVRQYDHEVQAATALKPFEGMQNASPNDCGIVWMGPHGNPGFEGAGVASGLAPDFSLMDGGIMALIAADEAVRNLVVTGVNPDKIALIDNFCWPDPLPSPSNPDAEHKLAQLVRTCESLSKLVYAYEMPLISGKDSMKNDFRGKLPTGEAVKISVLPTLLVTALGHHPDVRKIIKPHAKAGTKLYLLDTNPLPAREKYGNYFGATLPKYFELKSTQTLEGFDLQSTREFYQQFFHASEKNLIASAHDLSEGGLLFALFESLLFHECGIKIELSALFNSIDLPFTSENKSAFFFNENPGRILVSVASQNQAQFEAHFPSSQRLFLGEITNSGKIEIEEEVISVNHLGTLWRNVL